jgi:hypothetical protein
VVGGGDSMSSGEGGEPQSWPMGGRRATLEEQNETERQPEAKAKLADG